jgi:hypothetical protein
LLKLTTQANYLSAIVGIPTQVAGYSILDRDRLTQAAFAHTGENFSLLPNFVNDKLEEIN